MLLDEAELIGLGYSVDINATQKVTTTGDRQDVHVISQDTHHGEGGAAAVTDRGIRRERLPSESAAMGFDPRIAGIRDVDQEAVEVLQLVVSVVAEPGKEGVD